MKKSTRNVLIVLIIIIFILSLIAFNVNGIKKLFNKINLYSVADVVEECEEDFVVAETMAEAPMVNYSAKKTMASGMNNTMGNDGKVASIENDERKLIKNINIDCETQDYEGTYDLVRKKVNQYQGVIDNENYSNYTYNNRTKRNCYFDIRIPKDNTEKFVDDITNNVNVLSKNESVRDVTDNYYDAVARLKNYKIEETKLQELMNKATKIEDIISVEERLQNIRTEIEYIERRIKNLDKQIDYSTINISLSEVVVYSMTSDTMPTKEGLIAAFKKNFEDTKNFLINVGYYIFTHIPAICLVLCIGLIILIIAIIIVSITDGSSKKKEETNSKVNVEKVVKEEIKKEIKNDEKKEEKKAKTKNDKVERKIEKKIENNVTDVENIKEENNNETILEGNGLGKNVLKDKNEKKNEEKKVVKTYEDLREKLEEKAKEPKKDKDGFTMTDLNFTSTK